MFSRFKTGRVWEEAVADAQWQHPLPGQDARHHTCDLRATGFDRPPRRAARIIACIEDPAVIRKVLTQLAVTTQGAGPLHYLRMIS